MATELTSGLFINLPFDLFTWISWLILAGLLVFGLRQWTFPIPSLNWQRGAALVVLAVASFLFSRLLIIPLPNEAIYPVPGMPAEPVTPAIILLVNIPWVLAAGFIGSFWSILLAAFSGLFVALGQTHQLFTIVEYAGLAFFFNAAIRQTYRAGVYRLLHHPLGAAVLLAILYVPLYIISALLATPGVLEARMDYALTQNWMLVLARTLELLLAGLLGEVLYLVPVPYWHHSPAVDPSPEEKSLRVRIFYGTIPLVLVLFITLTVGDWIVAGDAARRMIMDRLSSTAQVAAESLPYFLETGHNLLQTFASPDLVTTSPGQLKNLLETRLYSVPFFRAMQLFDTKEQFVSAYPSRLEDAMLTEEEHAGISLALKGVLSQTYIVPALSGENTIQISFISPVLDANKQPIAVLLGRTDLANNPFTLPTLKAMDGIKDWQGEAIILDENGKILYHPLPALVGSDYDGRRPVKAEFYDEVSTTGRRLVYYQPMMGRPWAVVLSVPAERVQRTSLDIAFPLLVILFLLSAFTILFLSVNLRTVAESLRSLSHEAGMISRGQLDHPLALASADEVGQLGNAFEQMRHSLKDRLDELNRLLRVSQGVAGSLKIENALPPVLEAALGEDVSSARIVLGREVTLDLEGTHPVSLGRGLQAGAYAFLDEQIFEQVRSQPLLSIPNMNRVRRLVIPAGSPQPGSLVALALVQDNRYYGALWIAYDQPHNFADSELNFLGTLAGQAALAASNGRLYASAEIGRQRLSAVLASSPEPVLVIDEKNRMLLLNPAAAQAPGLVVSAESGRPVREVVANLELLELLTQPLEEKLASREVTLLNGRIYSASVSSVYAENRLVGRVCVLQDITHYKELDTLKSDFVATVSHDLRAPLTLMRGYATMLQMVGELNDQQKSFQKKILTGVETMTRLVNNLLDLGRLEAGISLQVEQINAQEIVAQVLATLQPNAVQKNIQVEHESVTLPPIYLEADRSLLQQAITNLVDNAIKYTSSGGKVKVGVQARVGTVVFSVKDTGIGVAPLDLPRLFEKFYRSGRREAHAQKGSGLGLAIVKSIAERHGGRVWVESQLGKGSAFYLEIPLQAKKP